MVGSSEGSHLVDLIVDYSLAYLDEGLCRVQLQSVSTLYRMAIAAANPFQEELPFPVELHPQESR